MASEMETRAFGNDKDEGPLTTGDTLEEAAAVHKFLVCALSRGYTVVLRSRDGREFVLQPVRDAGPLKDPR